MSLFSGEERLANAKLAIQNIKCSVCVNNPTQYQLQITNSNCLIRCGFFIPDGLKDYSGRVVERKEECLRVKAALEASKPEPGPCLDQFQMVAAEQCIARNGTSLKVGEQKWNRESFSSKKACQCSGDCMNTDVQYPLNDGRVACRFCAIQKNPQGIAIQQSKNTCIFSGIEGGCTTMNGWGRRNNPTHLVQSSDGIIRKKPTHLNCQSHPFARVAEVSIAPGTIGDHFAGDVVRQSDEYQTIEGVLEFDIDSTSNTLVILSDPTTLPFTLALMKNVTTKPEQKAIRSRGGKAGIEYSPAETKNVSTPALTIVTKNQPTNIPISKLQLKSSQIATIKRPNADTNLRWEPDLLKSKKKEWNKAITQAKKKAESQNNFALLHAIYQVDKATQLAINFFGGKSWPPATHISKFLQITHQQACQYAKMVGDAIRDVQQNDENVAFGRQCVYLLGDKNYRNGHGYMYPTKHCCTNLGTSEHVIIIWNPGATKNLLSARSMYRELPIPCPRIGRYPKEVDLLDIYTIVTAHTTHARNDMKECELCEFIIAEMDSLQEFYTPWNNATMSHEETRGWRCTFQGTPVDVENRIKEDMKRIKKKWLKRALAHEGFLQPEYTKDKLK